MNLSNLNQKLETIFHKQSSKHRVEGLLLIKTLLGYDEDENVEK